MAHQQKPIPSLCVPRADIPRELDEIFEKMVAKRAEDRYQTMNEVIADLERLRGGSAASASSGESTNSRLADLLGDVIHERTSSRTKTGKPPSRSTARSE